VRPVVGVVAAILILWVLLAYRLFYAPPLAPLPPTGEADVVVVLAGAATERLALGRELVERGEADTLVISSTGLPGNVAGDDLCAEKDPRTICFRPDPLTTRGEARAIADLARERGWDDVIVVTSTYHVTRAFTNVSQCSKATVTMAASRPDLDGAGWAARFVEESAALAAAVARPACAQPV
jgi:uncharacterized SAM-binding protein YcdF (DUF218 family)